MSTWTRPNSLDGPRAGAVAAYTLVTDTVVYDVVSTTAKTITVRPRLGTDTILDRVNHDGNPYPVLTLATASTPDADTRTLRLRKDGTYRMSRSSNPMRFYDGDPGRRVDYRR